MVRVSLPQESLSKLDFGAPAAERDIERGLDEYFVESEAYSRVKAGAKRILIGGRGIGKSALFQVLARRERDRGSYVIELSPEDYSYELLSQTMASQDRGSWAKRGAYAAAWKYLIYVLIMKEISTRRIQLGMGAGTTLANCTRRSCSHSPTAVGVALMTAFASPLLGACR